MKNWNVRKADRRARGYARASPAAAVFVLAAPGRPGRRRDRRHGILTLIGVGAGEGRAGGDPVLRHRRRDLRLRGARLCRGRDDDPGLGQRLHLFLRRVRRADRLGHRLVALILEYTLVVSAVAVGWSGYAADS